MGMGLCLSIGCSYLMGKATGIVRQTNPSEGVSTQKVASAEKDPIKSDLLFFFICLCAPCLFILYWIGSYMQRAHDKLLYHNEAPTVGKGLTMGRAADGEKRKGKHTSGPDGKTNPSLESTSEAVREGAEGKDPNISPVSGSIIRRMPEKAPEEEQKGRRKKKAHKRQSSGDEDDEEGEEVTFNMNDVYTLSKMLNDADESSEELSD